MAWRCALLTVITAFTQLQPLPQLALLSGESFQLPLADYFAGNSLSYSVSVAGAGEITVKGTKGLEFNSTLDLGGCEPLGIPIIYTQNEVFVFYLTECGVTQLQFTDQSLDFLWTSLLVGINSWEIGNSTLLLQVNQTELYIIEGGKDLQVVPLSLEPGFLKVIATLDLLVALYSQKLVFYTTADYQICGNWTSFEGNSLELVDAVYTDRLYIWDKVWGLLVISFAADCQAEGTSLGNITTGNSPRFGQGNGLFLSIQTSIGVYLFSTASLTLLNFQPLAATQVQTSVTRSDLVISTFNATGKRNLLVLGTEEDYVALYSVLDGSVTGALEGFVLSGDKEGLTVYRLDLAESYLEGSGSGNLQGKLLIRSNYPSDHSESLHFSIDILPFNSAAILHGTGLTASLAASSPVSISVRLNNSQFEADLPLCELFSGTNIDFFAVNASEVPGLSIDFATFESPYVKKEAGEWLEGWELGCSAANLQLLAYQPGFIALLDLTQPEITIQSQGTYEGVFQACIQTTSGFTLLSTANNLQSELTLLSPSLQATVSLYLPDQCSRLKVSSQHLLCIGLSLLHICTLDLAACVRVSALEVQDAAPFQLWDADFVVETVIVIADQNNGVRTLDVFGLLIGQATVPFLDSLASAPSPSVVVTHTSSLYLLSGNYTEFDLSEYPNLRPKRVLPLSHSGVEQAYITDKYIYVTGGLTWQAVDYRAETALQALKASIPQESGTYLVLPALNFDLFLHLFPNNSALTLSQVLPPTTPCAISLFGVVTAPAQLPSLSKIPVPVRVLAQSASSAANITVELAISAQGYFLWAAQPAISLNIDINDTYWVDLRTVFYGKEVKYSGESEENIGADLQTGLIQSLIEGCMGGKLWTAAGFNKITFLTENVLEICELQGNSLNSLFKYTANASCTAISAVSDQWNVYFSLYCQANSLIIGQYGLQNGSIMTKTTPAPASFQHSLSFLSNSTLFTVGFSPLSRLFHLSQSSLDLSLQTSTTVSKANLGLEDFLLVDIDGNFSSSQVLSLYIITHSEHFLQVDIRNFRPKLVQNRLVKARNVAVCGTALLAQGEDSILVMDSTGHVKKEIDTYEEGWTGWELSCFRGEYGEFAALWGGEEIAVLGFRTEPANSLLAVFPASDPPVFLSSSFLLSQNSSSLYLTHLQPPLLQLSPVPSPVSGVYTVTGENTHTDPVSVQFQVNRTDLGERRKDLGRVSEAGWWVWALIGLVGLGTAVATMVIFIRKRKAPARRRSINISLNPISS